jgi:DNA polymerase III delta prime subunit
MSNKFNPKNLMFTEKYRPKKIIELVGDFKTKISAYLKNPESIPHFLFYSRAPGTGKCLTKDEMFFTKNGLISFEDYCNNNNILNEYTNIKDTVYDIENNFVNTSYFYKNKDNVLKLTTKRGFEIKGTKEHQIKIFDLHNGFIWKKMSDIKTSDLIPIFFNTNIYGNNNVFNYEKYNKIKESKNATQLKQIKLPNEINNDIAYFLGLFVANGLFNGNGTNISTFKKWLVDKCEKILLDNFDISIKRKYDKRFNNKLIGFGISRKKFKDFLISVCGCSINTSRTKYIPKIIFSCSKSIQMNFINGLFEDSWISKEGYIEYSTASTQLAKEVHLLLLNLGFLCRKTEKYNSKYNHTYYSLVFNVEHSKLFVEYFNNIYKNKKIKFKTNMNTNVLTYHTYLRQFIYNKRIQNNIQSKDLYKLGYCRKGKLGASIKRFKQTVDLFLKESYLLDLKLFKENNIYLDTVDNIIDIGITDIYDFHIPNTHSFLASGIINHNTTLSKAIINELGCDYLIINSSDDRNIETVREKVKEFAITKSSNGIRRCIFLDEIDGMTKIAQDALRNIMESYASNVFFICTCNNINKVIEPIQSRCVSIQFSYPDRDEVRLFLESICKNEEMKYTIEGLDEIIKYNYPSIRNCVICLQDLKTENKDVIKDNIKPINSAFEEMWEKIKIKDWKTIKNIVMESTIDARELNTYFWEKSLEDENLKIIQICARNERDISFGADANIIVVTSLLEMIK